MSKSILDLELKFKKKHNKYYFELYCPTIVEFVNERPSTDIIGLVLKKYFKFNGTVYKIIDLTGEYVNLTSNVSDKFIKKDCIIEIYTDIIQKNNKLCIKKLILEVTPYCINTSNYLPQERDIGNDNFTLGCACKISSIKSVFTQLGYNSHKQLKIIRIIDSLPENIRKIIIETVLYSNIDPCDYEIIDYLKITDVKISNVSYSIQKRNNKKSLYIINDDFIEYIHGKFEYRILNDTADIALILNFNYKGQYSNNIEIDAGGKIYIPKNKNISIGYINGLGNELFSSLNIIPLYLYISGNYNGSLEGEKESVIITIHKDAKMTTESIQNKLYTPEFKLINYGQIIGANNSSYIRMKNNSSIENYGTIKDFDYIDNVNIKNYGTITNTDICLYSGNKLENKFKGVLNLNESNINNGGEFINNGTVTGNMMYTLKY